MKHIEISNIFNKIADLLEIKGDNPYRIRAYKKAAFNIEALGAKISSMSKEELMRIPGIGEDLAGKIEEYIKTGKIDIYEKLKLEIPEDLVKILNVPGLGPKTVRMLYKEFNIKNIDELEEIAKTHKLSTLKGVKNKTEENIIKGIEIFKRYLSKYPLGKVLPLANEITEYLSANAPLIRINIAGSLRRWKDTVRDIDIISSSKKPEKVMNTFTQMPWVKEVLMKGQTKSSIVMENGIQVDIRVVDEDSFGSALAYFTGSKSHNIRMRELALKSGLKLNEYGIFREKDDKKLGGQYEEDIYKILGLQYVPPELREDTGEIEAAIKGTLPNLIKNKDIKGDLHIHSNWSDGQQSLEELVKVSMNRGYEYIAVTDHSKGLGIAHGLNEEQIIDQKKMVDAINKKMKGFKLLAGIEVDIKSDGKLDFDDGILKQLDIVVAAIHSGFKQSREQITKRIIMAMKNPYVSVIAHISGRLIGERDAYETDLEEIFNTASKTGTALEINAYPLRLDLTETNAKIAKFKRVPIVISTDSHDISQLDYMKYGISVARRGWLEKKDVLNTGNYNRLVKKLKNKAK